MASPLRRQPFRLKTISWVISQDRKANNKTPFGWFRLRAEPWQEQSVCPFDYPPSNASDVLPSNVLAGGILGMGKVSSEEGQKLEELARAFS